MKKITVSWINNELVTSNGLLIGGTSFEPVASQDIQAWMVSCPTPIEKDCIIKICIGYGKTEHDARLIVENYFGVADETN